MATYEANIAKLRQYENWWSFTDPQRIFLDGMAKGQTPLDSIKSAYPDCKNGVALTKHMLERVGIQKALESIGIDVKKSNVTKSEALQTLSRQLRKANDPIVYLKLLGMYSKLSGWTEEEEPDEEVSLDKLVAAVEKKRKQL